MEGTIDALDDYGYTFHDPAEVRVEIVRWPAGGWRPVDPDTGDEGGTVEGVFPLVSRQRFLDRQGRVHARVSVEFADEFGCRLLIPGAT